MASETKATLQGDQAPQGQEPVSSPEDPMLELSDAAIEKIICTAKEHGYVTHDQINSVLHSKELSSKQTENVLAMFSEMGINVVEVAGRVRTTNSAKSLTKSRKPKASIWSRLSASSPPNPRPRSRLDARTIPCACTFAKWARSGFSRARAKSRSQNASRRAARP